MNCIELPQGSITYRITGPIDSAFPPVVFVHGLLADNQLWTSVADVLAHLGVRTFAPTWPTGSHPIPMEPDTDLSPRGVAKIIISFLEALDLSGVTLVGNDTGGAICQYLIDTDPRRIGRLVLTNCDAFDVFPPKEFEGLIRIGRHQALLWPMLTALRATPMRHARNVYGGVFVGIPDRFITRSWIEPGLSHAGVRRDLAKLIGAIDSSDLLDVSTRFDAFTKPVNIVWGDGDLFFPTAIGERLAAAFPNSSLTLIAGARTFVSMEFPREVADVIAKQPE